jgi:hypothetical protein
MKKPACHGDIRVSLADMCNLADMRSLVDVPGLVDVQRVTCSTCGYVRITSCGTCDVADRLHGIRAP